MYSGKRTRALPRVGFPIRRSRDQRLVSTSPGLIAAAHVLHRLLAPRHPPCALVLLIMKNTISVAMEFSRCPRAIPPYRQPAQGRSLKTQQREERRGRHVLGELDHRTPCLDGHPIYHQQEVPPEAKRHQRVERPTGVMAPESLERR